MDWLAQSSNQFSCLSKPVFSFISIMTVNIDENYSMPEVINSEESTTLLVPNTSHHWECSPAPSLNKYHQCNKCLRHRFSKWDQAIKLPRERECAPSAWQTPQQDRSFVQIVATRSRLRRQRLHPVLQRVSAQTAALNNLQILSSA